MQTRFAVFPLFS